jgi:hypothetical protein
MNGQPRPDKRTARMAIETRPQEGRPAMSAREAARILRRDVRTVRRMIEDGEIAGGAQPGQKYRRWYVYIDRLPSTAAPRRADAHAGAEVHTLRAENARLQADNTELRARLMSTEETNRLLLASQATLREAVTDYQSSIAEVLAGLDGYRQAADGYRDSAEHFHRGVTALQASNAKLNTVLDHYSDALSQHTTPAHPGDLRADGGI